MALSVILTDDEKSPNGAIKRHLTIRVSRSYVIYIQFMLTSRIYSQSHYLICGWSHSMRRQKLVKNARMMGGSWTVSEAIQSLCTLSRSTTHPRRLSEDIRFMSQMNPSGRSGIIHCTMPSDCTKPRMRQTW